MTMHTLINRLMAACDGKNLNKKIFSSLSSPLFLSLRLIFFTVPALSPAVCSFKFPRPAPCSQPRLSLCLVTMCTLLSHGRRGASLRAPSPQHAGPSSALPSARSSAAPVHQRALPRATGSSASTLPASSQRSCTRHRIPARLQHRYASLSVLSSNSIAGGSSHRSVWSLSRLPGRSLVLSLAVLLDHSAISSLSGFNLRNSASQWRSQPVTGAWAPL